MLNQFGELLRYQEWADWQFFKRWKQFPQAYEDGDIRTLTDHFTKVQSLFLQVLHQEKADLPDRNVSPASIHELIQRCQENHARMNTYVASLSGEKLSSKLDLSWFPGGNFRPTVSEVLLQVVMHTQHHRAQVLQSLAKYADKSIIIDWISWVFREKPVPVWE